MKEEIRGNKIIKPGENIIKPENTIEIVSELDEALKTENISLVQELLKSDWRNAIAQRGENNMNFGTIENAFDFLLEKEFANMPKIRKSGKKADVYNVDSREIIKYVKESGLSPDKLCDIMSIAFHKRDNKKFFRILAIIVENKEEISPEIFNIAMHNLASWESSVDADKKTGQQRERDRKSALGKNEKVEKTAIDLDDKVYSAKARYGIISNLDTIKPKKRAEIFLKIRDKFYEAGDDYDAMQAINEATKAYIALAMNQLNKVSNKKEKITDQKNKSLADDNLGLAKELALEALGKSLDIKYVNAEIKARENLSKIYYLFKDIKKAKSYEKKAEELRGKHNYRTIS